MKLRLFAFRRILVLNPLTITYLALGSNQGDKMQRLQQAIDLIFGQIGKINSISPVYKTPAWGFEGDDFLNACIEVETRLSAEETLHGLLQIEKKLGRASRKKDTRLLGYFDRNIDLDIVFFGNEISDDEHLTVPHPKMAERKFVLTPLKDIAPDFIHPQKNKSVSELLEITSDKSEIEKIRDEPKIPKLNLPAMHYLAIEGVIGAGKTSLARMIAEDFNGKLVLEGFKDNPFLPKFYEDPERYAFALEMSFLAERYQQLVDILGQYDLFSDFVVSDYDVGKSLVFAEITLQTDEFRLYKNLSHLIHKGLTPPDLYVYLYQTTDRLLENIKKRGRDYEQKIQPDYLEKVNRGYLDFIKNHPGRKTKIIDVSEMDFVGKREDYLKVLREMT